MLAVAAWNMHNNISSWSYLETLTNRFGVHVFLLQEAVPPDASPELVTVPRVDDRTAWKLGVPAGLHRNFCSAIACSDLALDLTPRPTIPLAGESYRMLAASHPGQFAVADISPSEDKAARVTVVSLYGIWEKMLDSDDIYADATLHRAISDLTAVFAARGNNKILVAGDLNIWHAYDEANKIKGWSREWSRRFASVFERLDGLGLTLIGPFRPDDAPLLDRCPCNSADCQHVNTYRYHAKPAATPYQNDFMFATDALKQRLIRCYAVEDDDIWDYSDHRPIVAEFDL